MQRKAFIVRGAKIVSNVLLYLFIALCLAAFLILIVQSRRAHPAENLYANKVSTGDAPEQSS